MSKAKEPKPSKAHHVFPAPEWTSLSASLAATLAHEIRNPLLSIKGAAQLLEQVVGADDKTLAALIITEAARIEKLIATMDPLTPNPASSMELINIHEVTEYARRAASGFAGGVKITTQYDPSLPEVRGHREALIQALINLIKNAIEALGESGDTGAPLPAGEAGLLNEPKASFSNPGEGASEQAHAQPCPHPDLQPNAKKHLGKSDLSQGRGSAASPSQPTITIGTRYLLGEHMQRPDGAKLHLQVSVTDNGPGVATDVVPRLFTPFSSSKEGGKGLGLAIVAKIIEEHGGLIAYDAPAEGGARFSVYLPVG